MSYNCFLNIWYPCNSLIWFLPYSLEHKFRIYFLMKKRIYTTFMIRSTFPFESSEIQKKFSKLTDTNTVQNFIETVSVQCSSRIFRRFWYSFRQLFTEKFRQYRDIQNFAISWNTKFHEIPSLTQWFFEHGLKYAGLVYIIL